MDRRQDKGVRNQFSKTPELKNSDRLKHLCAYTQTERHSWKTNGEEEAEIQIRNLNCYNKMRHKWNTWYWLLLIGVIRDHTDKLHWQLNPLKLGQLRTRQKELKQQLRKTDKQTNCRWESCIILALICLLAALFHRNVCCTSTCGLMFWNSVC